MGRKNQAYEYLKQEILTGAIPPGAPVREMDLSEKLQMSRTPIREALRELEAEGVLISYPSRGTFVTSLTPYDVEEIYELRVLLEICALGKSLHRITDEELDGVEAIFTQSYQAFDWQQFHKADKMLHRYIVEKSCSKRLVSFINTLNTQIERIRNYGAKDPKRKERSYHEHMAIIHAIRMRDLDQATEALREHLRAVANSAIETAKMLDVDLFVKQNGN